MLPGLGSRRFDLTRAASSELPKSSAIWLRLAVSPVKSDENSYEKITSLVSLGPAVGLARYSPSRRALCCPLSADDAATRTAA